MKSKECENTNCQNAIEIPSLDIKGQCEPCARASRNRVKVGLEIVQGIELKAKTQVHSKL